MILMSDWVLLGTVGFGIGILIASGEWVYRWNGSAAIRRHYVPVCGGLVVAASPWLFASPGPVALLAGGAVLIGAGALWTNRPPGRYAARPWSWDAVRLAVAVLLALPLTWGLSSDRILVFQVSFLVVGVAGPLASGVEARWEASGGEATALLRTVTAGTVASLLVAGCLWAAGWRGESLVGSAFATGLVAAVVEVISRRGGSSLTVVFAVLLVLIPLQEHLVSWQQMGGGLALGGALTTVAMYARALTPRGALGAGLFAASLVALGGWAWVVPGLVFFGLSSALSYLPVPSRTQENGSPRRTLRQVLANGGVAWGCLGAAALLPPDGPVSFWGYVGFVGALSAAAADTWATELGERFGGRPWSIRTLRPVPPGQSGAVSGLGTLAGGVGAGVVAGSAVLVAGEAVSIEAGGYWALAGMGGMLADTLAGATIQAHYEVPGSDDLVEGPRDDARWVRGWRQIGNDGVNVICTATGALLALLLVGVA